MKGSCYYNKIPIHEEQMLVGNKICHKNGDSSTAIFIPVEGWCPLPECVAMYVQCCHKLVNDNVNSF